MKWIVASKRRPSLGQVPTEIPPGWGIAEKNPKSGLCQPCLGL